MGRMSMMTMILQNLYPFYINYDKVCKRKIENGKKNEKVRGELKDFPDFLLKYKSFGKFFIDFF